MTSWQTIALDRPLLLEASAGTGKTFAIEHLVLRALWEQRLTLDRLLVMTYTKAAAEDLRQRISARVQRAMDLLQADQEPGEGDLILCQLLLRWLGVAEHLSDQPWCQIVHPCVATPMWRELREVLRRAMEDAHRAMIGTTHSLCQRLLARYQLESGVLQSQDISAHDQMLQQAVEVWWLEQFSQFPVPLREGLPAELGTISFWHTLADELPQGASASRVVLQLPTGGWELSPAPAMVSRADLPPAASVGERLLAQLAALHAGIVAHWQREGRTITERLGQDVEAGLTSGTYVKPAAGHRSPWSWFAELMERGPHSVRVEPHAVRLYHQQWLDKPIYKNDYNERLQWLRAQPWVAAWTVYIQRVEEVELQLQIECVTHFVQWVRDYIGAHRSARAATFEQLSQRLYDAVRGNAGFARQLRRDFPFAVVDEFQDTDPVQWGIVRELYCRSDEAGALVLVGDPKQAIYGFRGADLACYGDARRTVQALGSDRIIDLRHNRRSDGRLVHACNSLFGGGLWSVPPGDDPAIMHPAGASSYVPAVATQTRPSGLPHALEIIVADDMTSSDYTAYVADQVQGLLTRLPELTPDQVAVITQRNAEAEDMFEALRQRRIPVQLQRSSSVWASRGAGYAQQMLALLLAPVGERSLSELHALPWSASERTLDDLEQVQSQWHHGGLRAAALQLCAPAPRDQTVWDQVALRFWSDMLHCCELCDAQLMMHSAPAVLRWLQQQRAHAARDNMYGGDSALARPTAAPAAVQVLTSHGSKGLEFDYVFVPYAFRGRVSKGEVRLSSVLTEQGPERRIYLRTFGNGTDELLEQDRRENLRLLYVALTRARRYVWIGWHSAYPKHMQGPLPYLLTGRLSDEQARQTLSAAAHAASLGVQIARRSGFMDLPVHPLPAAAPRPEPVGRSPDRLAYTGLVARSVTSFTALHATQDARIESSHPEMIEPAAGGLFGSLPRGAGGGLFLHGVLEHLAQNPELAAAVARGESPTLWEQAQRRTAHRYGQGDIFAQFATIEDWQSLLQAPLGLHQQPGMNLAQLLTQAELLQPEVTYTLSMPRGLRQPPHPDLARAMRDLEWPGDRIEGQMDLAVKVAGRWYLLDYKTNSLPSYHAGAMEQAMTDANYHLQAWLYWTAMVRAAMLRAGVRDFSRRWYEDAMGEVVYLFVRGMHRAPEQGVWHQRPDFELVGQLLALNEGTHA